MHILVVEDSDFAAQIATSLLKLEGHTTDIATTGEEAVTMAADNEYQVIFMDIGLPGIDGFTAGRKIHEFSPHAKIIGLTAHAIDDTFTTRAKESHFIDIIAKPLNKTYIDTLYSL